MTKIEKAGGKNSCLPCAALSIFFKTDQCTQRVAVNGKRKIKFFWMCKIKWPEEWCEYSHDGPFFVKGIPCRTCYYWDFVANTHRFDTRYHTNSPPEENDVGIPTMLNICKRNPTTNVYVAEILLQTHIGSISPSPTVRDLPRLHSAVTLAYFDHYTCIGWKRKNSGITIIQWGCFFFFWNNLQWLVRWYCKWIALVLRMLLSCMLPPTHGDNEWWWHVAAGRMLADAGGWLYGW